MSFTGRRLSSSSNRAQGSVETLLILIAALLVATATAGVLFDVIGGFESEAASTGERSADQVVSRVEVVGVTGHVNTDVESIEAVTLVLKPADGSGGIDAASIVVDTEIGHGASVAVGSSTDLSLTALADDDGSLDHDVLNHVDDRVALDIDLDALTGTQLRPRSSGRLRLLSPSGATTTVRLSVPSSLDGATVAL